MESGKGKGKFKSVRYKLEETAKGKAKGAQLIRKLKKQIKMKRKFMENDLEMERNSIYVLLVNSKTKEKPRERENVA